MLFVNLPQRNPEIHPGLYEKVVCATISPHLYLLLYPCAVLPAPRQLQSEGFNNEVCHVMKIAIAQSNPYMELSTQQAFYFSSSVLARGNKTPVETVPVACDWGLYVTHNKSL